MIWSVIPEEVIFDHRENDLYELKRYHGRHVIMRNSRLEALVSSDPMDFLDDQFTPGRLL